MRKEGFYSQRQFAKITGISTVTLAKLVKDGVIKLQPNGTISGEELRKLVIVELRKKHADNILLFQFGSAESGLQTVNNLVDYYNKHKQPKKGGVVYYDSVDSLVSAIINYQPATQSKVFLENRYTKCICKEFLDKYKQGMQSLFIAKTEDNMSNSHDSLHLNDLPNGVVYDLFMFGKPDEIYDYSGVANCLNVLDGVLNEKFSQIMKSLQLVNENGKLLFERLELTKEILKDTDSFYNFLITKLPKYKDELGKEFCNLPCKVERIFMQEAERVQTGSLKDTINTVIHNDRVITAVHLNVEHTLEDVLNVLSYLTGVLSSGLFSEIMFSITEEQYNEYMPDLLKNLLSNYDANGVKFTFAS